MKSVPFNNGWFYKHLGSGEAAIPAALPHDAMLRENRSSLSPGGINTGWYEGHDYLYSKTFNIPQEYEGKKIIFEFEGVYHNAEVMVNGKKAAFRPYGYTNFYVDTEGYLNFGQANEIQVIARNSDQPNSRWYSGAGIYRPAVMWISDRQRILLNGVKIHTVSLHPAVIEIRVLTEGEGDVNISISDGRKEVFCRSASAIGELVMEAEIPDARLWEPGKGGLYSCRVTFVTDEETVTFGIRTVTYGSNGLYINGERVILRGACIHHDNGLLGACAYPEAEERKVRILMENGYNALRSAHNPCSKALLEACDRQGMLVMDEYADAWYIHKTEYDYVRYFEDWWREDLKDLVDKDYNHPSVILYSTGNEVSETAQKKGIQLTKDMTEYLHTLDDRPVTCGINIFFNLLSSIGFGVYNDKKARKEVKKAGKRKAVGSEFFNNLAGLLGDNTMKLGATLHGCDVKTRDAFAAMDIAGYNYGILRYRHDLKKYPNRLILGSETFCKDAYLFWELAKRNTRIIGDFVWAGMDYLGEVGIGAWEYKDYAPDFSHGPGWLSAGSGRIDLTGKPLAEAAYTRVAFELEKGPVIAVRPVNHTGEKHSPSAWKMTNALESWSFRGCEGHKAEVEVYARAHSVELLINGTSVGKKALKNACRTLFHTAYENGEITAISYDRSGKEIARSSLLTAGRETVLQVTPEQPEAAKGGLCFIRLKYTDLNGITKPLERHRLHVTVTGGQLAALGSACPYNSDGWLSDTTDTYFGEALAIVAASSGDEIHLSATDGIHTGETRVKITERSDLE
ncbi:MULTISPECIES: glycoside hydrolase family 2 TIM barrel-domain containing protein [Hungatella]|uniref:DUF4982 domain-containing protein n=1 Tax=Hungatella hathewayi TaxID=154046 RepID=A0AAW9WM68_9FIRM|nr:MULTISPECIES: glycoside hydrolase family 2 TIM barrel-domain containing protein [Hungatella]MCQ4830353.1 glycoside hydrolase family 2 protein [Hungatella sp. SL.1.14]MUB66470.1 DUF4982 domain-containing protein [Hungatella hathewayi]CUQ52463.1 glycoside hydrolase [Hungatella hathewayi]